MLLMAEAWDSPHRHLLKALHLDPLAVRPAPLDLDPLAVHPAPSDLDPLAVHPDPSDLDPLAVRPAPSDLDPLAVRPPPSDLDPLAVRPAPSDLDPLAVRPAPSDPAAPGTCHPYLGQAAVTRLALTAGRLNPPEVARCPGLAERRTRRPSGADPPRHPANVWVVTWSVPWHGLSTGVDEGGWVAQVGCTGGGRAHGLGACMAAHGRVA